MCKTWKHINIKTAFTTSTMTYFSKFFKINVTEVYYQNAMQFHNAFILKLQYICCNVHFLDVVKLQYICSNFTTLYFRDTFSCIVKLHCILVINIHYIYRKTTVEIFNCVYSLIFGLNIL